MSKVLYCSKCGQETDHIETDAIEHLTTCCSISTFGFGTWLRRNVPKDAPKTVYKCSKCGCFNTETDDGFLD